MRLGRREEGTKGEVGEGRREGWVGGWDAKKTSEKLYRRSKMITALLSISFSRIKEAFFFSKMSGRGNHFFPYTVLISPEKKENSKKEQKIE